MKRDREDVSHRTPPVTNEPRQDVTLCVEIVGGYVTVVLPRGRVTRLSMSAEEAERLGEELIAKAKALRGK